MNGPMRFELPILKSLDANQVLCIVLFIVVFAVYRYSTSPWRSVPSGPARLPLVGNLFNFPASNRWTHFTEWRKKYGDIIYLNVLGQPIVILASHEAAVDLLERRGNIYSDRPRFIVADELLSGGNHMAFMPSNNTWLRHRKAAQANLQKDVARKYYEIQQTESVILCSQLLLDDKNWHSQFVRTCASTTMSILYDTKPILDCNDPRMKEIMDSVAEHAKSSAPEAHLVEFLPWMRYLPNWMAKWKRDAQSSYKRNTAMFERYLCLVTNRQEKGEDRPCISAELLRNMDAHNLNLQESAWLSGVIFGTSAEAMTSQLSWILLALVLNPDVQERAQEELDQVIGRSRLPTFNDRTHLPYTTAVVNESLRWANISPFSVPHRTSVDDWYNGYFIPKNTIIIPNVRGIHRDASLYGDDAEKFDPTRYMASNGRPVPRLEDGAEDGHRAYGWGPRICVGRHVATNTLFINTAMLLWAFKIDRATDLDGKPTLIDVEDCIEHGAVVGPAPFEVKLTPRFPEVVSMIESTKEVLEL